MPPAHITAFNIKDPVLRYMFQDGGEVLQKIVIFKFHQFAVRDAHFKSLLVGGSKAGLKIFLSLGLSDCVFIPCNCLLCGHCHFSLCDVMGQGRGRGRE